MHTRVVDNPALIRALSHGLTFASDADINRRILTKFGRHCYLYNSDKYNRDTLQTIIDEWADYTNKLYVTTQYEYNPIENYDREEQWTDTRTDNLNEMNTRTDNLNEDVTRTDNLTQNNTHTEKTKNTQNNNQLPNGWAEETFNSGYDSTSQTPTEKVVRTGSFATTNESIIETVNPTQTETRNTGTQTVGTENTGTQTNEKVNTGTETNVHNGRVHGNIGTMSTQQMIEQQRRIIVDCEDFYVAKFAECFGLDSRHLLQSIMEEDDDDDNEI